MVVPVDIDNADGVRGAEIDISFTPSLLQTSQAAVVAGSVWPQGAVVEANVNNTAGTIAAIVANAQALPAGGGSLLNVDFTINSRAVAGQSTAIDLTNAVLNSGAIVPNPEPKPGPDPTDGLVTFVGNTASVSGIVYADTSGTGQPEANEGVPGVEIILTNTATGQQWSTSTADSGQYSFSKLPAGAYRIVEQQPPALLAGGPTEIAATLSTGQSLTGQNFRTEGLCRSTSITGCCPRPSSRSAHRVGTR